MHTSNRNLTGTNKRVTNLSKDKVDKFSCTVRTEITQNCLTKLLHLSFLKA